MDGTLTIPNLDFGLMYERCGVNVSEDLLSAVAKMPPAAGERARSVIEEMEEEGRRTLELEPGATDLALWLRRHGIPMALVTRNSASTVNHFHSALWQPAGLPPFEPAISRDDEFPHKPDPAALGAIACRWGMELGPHILMVGDSPKNDVGFGKAAGVSTALVDGSRRYVEGGQDYGTDMRVDNLRGLPQLLWRCFDLEGQLGTRTPLQHYESPRPSSAAASAAASGDVDVLRTLSQDELCAADASGNTPLIWAADRGHLAAVELLLNERVDVNAKGFLGATAVSRACGRGHSPVLRALLTSPFMTSMNEPNAKMQSPLHFAAFKGHLEAVELMLTFGASTTVLDRKGRTPAEDTSDEQIRDAILKARAARVQ